MSKIIHCKECRFWGDEKYDWHGNRPCKAASDLFFVGGGDNNDGLYTSPNFYCAAAQHRSAGDVAVSGESEKSSGDFAQRA